MDAAAGRSEYADARFVRTQSERLATRNGELDQLDSEDTEGIGVRVRVGGAWGFAAVRGTDKADAEAALERALAIAEAQPAARGAALAAEPPARGTYASPAERDPFEVPLEDKLAVLVRGGRRAAHRAARSRSRSRASRRSASDKLFASTEGALCEQRADRVRRRAGRRRRGRRARRQVRSYPASHGGHVAQAGYEHFLALDLPGHAPRVAAEAAALLQRARLPARRSTTLILAGEQLGAPGPRVGRPRRRARPRARARGLVRRHQLRRRPTRSASLRFGSEHVNVTADATTPGGLGCFRWDDEGVEGRSVADHPRRRAARLPLLARDGRRDRPRPLRRLHARRRASRASRSCG